MKNESHSMLFFAVLEFVEGVASHRQSYDQSPGREPEPEPETREPSTGTRAQRKRVVPCKLPVSKIPEVLFHPDTYAALWPRHQNQHAQPVPVPGHACIYIFVLNLQPCIPIHQPHSGGVLRSRKPLEPRSVLVAIGLFLLCDDE